MDDSSERTLSIDVGGTWIKSGIVAGDGVLLGEPASMPTPSPSIPEALLAALGAILAEDRGCERVSIGFPGELHAGRVSGALNLDERWEGLPLYDELAKLADRPFRIVNDADMACLGANSGHGLEIMLTLGTGLGSGLAHEGRLVPNIELGRLLQADGGSLEDGLRDRVLRSVGVDAWLVRLDAALRRVLRCIPADRVFLGGGNARCVDRVPAERWPVEVRVVGNDVAHRGAAALWNEEVWAAIAPSVAGRRTRV